MMAAKPRLAADEQMIEINAGKPCKHSRKNIREVVFYLLNYRIQISQSSTDIIGKLEPAGKITLYLIFQG